MPFDQKSPRLDFFSSGHENPIFWQKNDDMRKKARTASSRSTAVNVGVGFSVGVVVVRVDADAAQTLKIC